MMTPTVMSIFEQDVPTVAIIEEESSKNQLELKDFRSFEDNLKFGVVDLTDTETHLFSHSNNNFSSIYLDPVSPPPRFI